MIMRVLPYCTTQSKFLQTPIRTAHRYHNNITRALAPIGCKPKKPASVTKNPEPIITKVTTIADRVAEAIPKRADLEEEEEEDIPKTTEVVAVRTRVVRARNRVVCMPTRHIKYRLSTMDGNRGDVAQRYFLYSKINYRPTIRRMNRL
uniref:Uncharacterized protein n=1 Tax=Cacopsylla melanoneura TaxID=428564 RepID=A0A8D8ZY35_9HEMI